MESVSYWIYEIALLVSGFIYVHTIEPRERTGKRIWIDVTAYLILIAMINSYLPINIFWLEMLARTAGLVFLAHFLYMGRCLTKRAAMYYAIWAFMSWQLLYEIRIILYKIIGHIPEVTIIGKWLGEIGVFVVGYTIIGFTIAKWMPDGGEKKIGPRQFGLAVLVFSVFEIISFLPTGREITASSWIAMYLTQVLLAVILYLQNELFKKSEMKQELEMVKLLWKKEQEQYRMSKENIALINQKCHDLKHQIRAIRQADYREQEEYLKEVENSIEIYEAIVKTGNEVLDTILTEKSLYCKEKGIVVSCVADGRQLNFINTIDLYSILGNAIDNAIEAVEKLQKQEMRQIDVLIYRQQQFVAINVINPIEEEVVYEEELPITTKENKGYHGYGLKSMKYMLEKYNGFFSIVTEDGCFSIMMLIPIPQKQIEVSK